MGLSVISIFKCKSHYRSCVLSDILEKTIDNELPLPFGEFYVSCTLSIPHAVTLQIATLAPTTVSTVATGDLSQNTPIQSTRVFVLCCSTQMALCGILIPVSVLLVTWRVLIN